MLYTYTYLFIYVLYVARGGDTPRKTQEQSKETHTAYRASAYISRLVYVLPY